VTPIRPGFSPKSPYGLQHGIKNVPVKEKHGEGNYNRRRQNDFAKREVQHGGHPKIRGQKSRYSKYTSRFARRQAKKIRYSAPASSAK
jgi:hypothetical protein